MKNRPNIVLLQGEDVGRHLGCYGDPIAHTPHLDQLATEGVRYTNAFTHTPVCAPSRGGMVTGRYPYSLGNHHMRSTLAEPPRHFIQELKDAGYVVNWHSKMDFNFEPEEGWRDSDDAWVEHPPPDQPFFVYENFHTTHESTMFPKRPKWKAPPPEYATREANHQPEDMIPPPWLTDCPELRTQLTQYYNSFTTIDALIGNRLKWLDDHNLRENTIVIFLSDHGRGLPREKRWCYDAGIHLPLIIRWPDHLEPGTVSDDMTAWVDIAPTLLSIAGVSIPEDYQGQVFLGEEQAPPREYAFAGRDRMDEIFDRVRCVRSKEWHYIRNFAPKLPWAQVQKYMEQQEVMQVMRKKYADGTLTEDEKTFFRDQKPVEELYHAESDPDCMNNLAGNPKCTDVLESMRDQLDTHLAEVQDLGSTTEEDLVANGILTNRIPEYRERKEQRPDLPGPEPSDFPMTLRDAVAGGWVDN